MQRIMRYPGSKARPLPVIREIYLKSGSESFIDVFGGSGTVLLNIESISKVYNDIDPDLYSIFEAIKNNYTEFAAELRKIAKTKETFMGFGKGTVTISRSSGGIYNAARTFWKFNTLFGGLGDTYGKMDKSTYGRFIKSIKILEESVNDIRSWTLENMDFREIVRKYDGVRSFFYFDPPYPGKNWYNYNFKREDYEDLRSLMRKMSGKYLMNLDSADECLKSIFGNPSFVRKYVNLNGRDDSNGKKFRYVSFYTNVT